MNFITRLLCTKLGIGAVVLVALSFLSLWVLVFARRTPELPETYVPVAWYQNINAEDIVWERAGPFALEKQTRRPWIHTPLGWVSPAAPKVQRSWLRTSVSRSWL